MLKIVVGHSEDVDSKDAITDALYQCKKQLGSLIPQAGIVYCAMDYEYKVILDELVNEYPGIQLIGCTTDGEISSYLGCVEDSVTVTLFYSDNIEIKAGLGRNLSTDTNKATENAIKEAENKLNSEPKFAIVIAESMTVGGVAILEGIKKTLGKEFPIFGGLAADQWIMKKTYQFYQNEVLTDSVQILLFSGDIIISSGISSGWVPIGHKKQVTNVKNNIIYELDNEPILDFYNRYVGGDYSRVPTEYPLAVYPDKEEKFYIRSPHTFNEEDRSITFFGDVPNNITVQLVTGTIENISRASEEALNIAIKGYKGKKPEAAFVFTCSARKAILGIKAYKEYELLQEVMPKNFSINGFYTYGEIAPLVNGKESRFHNGTIVVLLIGVE